MHDFHPVFVTYLSLLMLFAIFSVFTFYRWNESSMRSGFKKALSKWGNSSIYDINSRKSLTDYLHHLSSSK